MLASGIAKVYQSIRQRGVLGTLTQMYMVGDIRFGVLKGTDRLGNKYYEDLNMPFGQHRWVEYAEIHNFDTTMIQPEWFRWIHHTCDETPDEERAMEASRHMMNDETDTKYKTHQYQPPQLPPSQLNKSQFRARGWNVGSISTKPEEPDQFWMQPGHPLHPLAEKGGRFKDGRIYDTWDPNEAIEKPDLDILNKKP